MKDNHLKVQLKQLLKQGYSINELSHMSIAPAYLLDLVIEELNAEQRITNQTLSNQHHQASFAMRLGC